MANTILTPLQITREAMRILENNSVLCRVADRQYDKSFASDPNIGDTLRIRKPSRYLVTDGPTLAVQDTTQQKVDLVVSNQKHVDMAFTDQELTLSISRFSELIIEPAVSQLATSVDLAVFLASIKQIGNSVGTPGATPATVATLLAANQKMNEMATPTSQRSLIVNPAANAALVGGEMKALFNPAGVLSEQYKEGMMASNVLGYRDISMSQNVPQFTTGTRSGTITVSVTSVQGATTIVLDATTGHTFKEGDVFTIAGVNAVNPQTRQTTGSPFQFVVKADATAASSLVTLTVDAIYAGENQQLATVDALPAATAVVTFVGGAGVSYPQNLALHKQALAFVTADMPLPKGMDMASRIVHNGISLRFVRGFDITNSRFVSRLDILFGSQVVRPEMACRVWG